MVSQSQYALAKLNSFTRLVSISDVVLDCNTIPGQTVLLVAMWISLTGTVRLSRNACLPVNMLFGLTSKGTMR